MAGAAAAAMLPRVASAQQRRPTRKIGYLHSITLAGSSSLTLSVMRRHWARLGYVEGETVLLRSAEGDPSRLPGLVRDLLAQDVAAIIVIGAEALRAAAATTKTTPIVAVDLETNPVSAGYASSYARPGGNVTGAFLDQPSLAGKWLDILRDVVPELDHVGLLWDPSTGRDQLAVLETQARQRSISTSIVPWREISDFNSAFAPLKTGRSGIITLTAPGFSRAATEVGRGATTNGIPAITFLKAYLTSGILMSYGPDNAAHFGRAMVFVEKILEGASPATLPIEIPSRFEFVVDMRAARAIDITVPATLLAQADDLIE
ncbi:MAG: ABC transporter substrate-binding protein [Alsobacter sp.]